MNPDEQPAVDHVRVPTKSPAQARKHPIAGKVTGAGAVIAAGAAIAGALKYWFGG